MISPIAGCKYLGGMRKLHEAASLLKAADSSSGRQLIFKNLLCAYFLFTACKNTHIFPNHLPENEGNLKKNNFYSSTKILAQGAKKNTST
jgi:hypothetical protein